MFLNDRTDFAELGFTHFVVLFKTKDELMACFERFGEAVTVVDPFVWTEYSELVGNFKDRFGVMWGFMVGEQ